MKAKKNKYLFTLSLILTLGSFILSQVFKGSINNTAFLDNIIYAPTIVAWLLLLLLSNDIFGNSSKRIFLSGAVLLVIGYSSNTLVSIVNSGGFPIYGYSLEEFSLLDTNMYHFIASKSTTLYMLGDLKIFSGHSAGDLMIYLGLFLITISLLPFILRHLFSGE